MKNITITAIALFSLLAMAAYSHALCVQVPEANLRSGPGTKYEKTWEVFKYMPFNKISQKNSWYKVKDVDGDVHWIYKKLVTTKFKCAVVKGDKVNVRSGPGTKYSTNALSPALKYDSFKIIEMKKSWVKVIDEFGDTGWLSRKLVWIQ